MLTCFALLFIPLLQRVVIAAIKVPPIPVHGIGGPGEPRPPSAAAGRAFAGIGAGARSNYEHMSDRPTQVADTGPGIFMNERAAIDALYSGSVPVSSQLKGTRISLSVVSAFVLPHVVEILDCMFPGARSCLRLPLAPALEWEPT